MGKFKFDRANNKLVKGEQALDLHPTDQGEFLVRATDLASWMKVNKRSVLKTAQGLDPRYKCALKVHGSTGWRDALFLTLSGACQVLVTARSPECDSLREAVCDFYIDNKLGRAQSQAPSDGQVDEFFKLVHRMLDRMDSQDRKLAKLEDKVNRRGGTDDHGPHDADARRRMRNRGFYRSAEYLAIHFGSPQPGNVAQKVTAACKKLVEKEQAWDRQDRCGHGGDYIYFHESVLSVAVKKLPWGQLELDGVTRAAERLLGDGDE